MQNFYQPDLAYIHDAGFGDFARAAAPDILARLKRVMPPGRQVIDLGCGSGILAKALLRAGYRVLGIDISPAMIALARQTAPEAEFRAGSVFRETLPPCAGVIAVGECINYLFDPLNETEGLEGLFQKIYRVLPQNGMFIFDFLEPGQVPGGTAVRSFTEGDDWAVLVEKQEDSARRILTRRIVTFRRMGADYRRGEEVHRVRLYTAGEVLGLLRRTGFRARRFRGYGEFRLRRGHAVIVARKK